MSWWKSAKISPKNYAWYVVYCCIVQNKVIIKMNIIKKSYTIVQNIIKYIMQIYRVFILLFIRDFLFIIIPSNEH